MDASAVLPFEPLTPTAFLDRAARVFADRPAVLESGGVVSYAALHDHCRRFAGALAALGTEPGNRVAVLSPNTRLLLESHYAVPYAGGVLVALNHRLADAEVGEILAHSGSRLLLLESTYADRARAIASAAPDVKIVHAGEGSDLEARIGNAEALQVPVADERGLLSINYTSGTTGSPKGVMYHHRGAYLQALAMAFHTRLDTRSVMLWTLPMFHCNGWCFTWGTTAAGATHVPLPNIDPEKIWQHIREDGVTHLNAAPTVLTMLAAHNDAAPAPRRVTVCTGGAPPSPTLLEQLGELNFDVTHLYGLTETFGPSVICEWQPAWDAADAATRARLVARQGVGNVISEPLRVVDADGADVPADGQTPGEVAMRGNNVMLGYYRDPDATAKAAPDGWFRTGDIGVMHSDGYLELRDRAKDIIISGGENIASVEVEQALLRHPVVLECAVVGAPDPKWGETVVAYVTVRSDRSVDQDELTSHVRQSIAHYKAPRHILVVSELPKTSTGKIQKHVLRASARQDVAR